MQMVTYESVESNTTLEELGELGAAVHNLTVRIENLSFPKTPAFRAAVFSVGVRLL